MPTVPPSQRRPTGIAETMPVTCDPCIGPINHRADSREVGHPPERHEPTHLFCQVKHRIGTPESPAIGQEELDLTRQLTGSEVEFTGDVRILKRHERESERGEDRMPSVAQCGADGTKGIEGDPSARSNRRSAINFHFSIHRNLRSKNLPNPVLSLISIVGVLPIHPQNPTRHPGPMPSIFNALSPIDANRDNADGDHPRSCEYHPVVVSKNPSNSRNFASV